MTLLQRDPRLGSPWADSFKTFKTRLLETYVHKDSEPDVSAEGTALVRFQSACNLVPKGDSACWAGVGHNILFSMTNWRLALDPLAQAAIKKITSR